MSKRKRNIDKQKRAKQRQAVKAAKAKRQQNSYYKWEEKKAKKRSSQIAAKEGKFPGISKECWLESFQNPQPKYCSECGLECPYNTSN